MSEEDAAYIIKQLLSAITYCHCRGVVHRDLKPENILIESISSNGKINIKVIDFGTALFVAPNTKLVGTLGTPYYIAPEVIRGDYNEKCDIWSIGVILYILLSGHAPFNGDNEKEIMDNVERGEYSFKSKIFL
jgi:calcium-dependent protein kinase